jgi:3-hydroxymyristoyl/3-hydroxydecanoyl-(acyl carrier protein) dehydratase
MDIAKLKERTIKKTFNYSYTNSEGKKEVEEITIEFYQKCLTPAFLDSLTQYEQKKDSSAIAKHISRNLVSWSLHFNGEPFQPSVENLTEVCDFDFLMQIVTAMSDTFSGNEQKPTALQSGSAVSEQSETEVVN